MTQFDHKKASELIAELYGVDAKLKRWNFAGKPYYILITQDSGTMAELAWENRISPIFYPREVHIVLHDGTCVHEYYADHTSIAEATRVAIAKALIKLKGKEL